MTAATRQYAFRLSAGLVERIDRYAAQRARIDGRACSRSDAVRVLLEKGFTTMYDRGTQRFMETPAKPESRITGLVTDNFEGPAQPLEEHGHDEHRRKGGLWALPLESPEPWKAKSTKKR